MLSDADFAFVSRELKTRAGPILSREMGALAEQRLTPLARREGHATVSEFLGHARAKQDHKIWTAIADALVQTETRFFRDKPNFERLRRDILPMLDKTRPPSEPIRVWSAGCGAGQEAYSLAILAEEWRNEGGRAVEILATDFSDRLLDKARSGLYTQFEIQRGLPIRKLIAYFEKAGDLWRIVDRMRAGVRFEGHNLLASPAALAGFVGGPFDVILCCHVLSSFDEDTKRQTIARLGEAAADDAILLLGAGETLPPGCDAFQAASNLITRKKPSARAA